MDSELQHATPLLQQFLSEVESDLKSCNLAESSFPECLSTTFQRLSLKNEERCESVNIDQVRQDEKMDEEDYGESVVMAQQSSPLLDVDLVDYDGGHHQASVPNRRSKFDQIRLEEFRSHITDVASDVIRSVYDGCRSPDSTNNNSNLRAVVSASDTTSRDGAVTATVVASPRAAIYMYGDGRQWHTEAATTMTTAPLIPASVVDGVERARPRKRVSFTSAPSIRWFRKDEDIDLPCRRRQSRLISTLRHLVWTQRRPREERKYAVVPILKKKHRRF